MILFVTDNESIYNSSQQTNKLLFEPYHFLRCSFMQDSELQLFNLTLNAIEYKAAEYMLKTLYRDIIRFEKENFLVNKFLATRSKQSQLQTLLYINYWHLLTAKYGIELCVQKMLDYNREQLFSKIDFHLSAKYALLKVNESLLLDKELTVKIIDERSPGRFNKLLKQFYYRTYQACSSVLKKVRTPSISTQKHILVFLYDAPSIHIVLAEFLELVTLQKEKIFLSIIEVSNNVTNKIKASAKKYECENIAVYNFEEFRCGHSVIHTDIFSFLESQHKAYSVCRKHNYLDAIELRYAWVNNIFNRLMPDASLYLGVLEMGRAVSDVSRYHQKPSVNVDYGMFSNDPYFMESNIKFTYRACISKTSSEIWRERKDPTHYHEIIGFCKLDLAKKATPDKKHFFSEYKLNIKSKTVVFASTWTGNNKLYEYEKRMIVKNLSQICLKNNWNLIVKKHPSESDTIVDDVLKNQPAQCVANTDINIYELLSYCDFLSTQSSSIVSEALYMDKPFCYISLSKEVNVNSYSAMAHEELVQVFYDFETLENFLSTLFIKENYLNFVNAMQPLKEKYLFKTDGLASQRLLNLLLEKC